LYAPTVAQVFANGTTWPQDYRNYLASLGLGSSQFGYAIPKGINQAAALTWGNINQISIQFNEDVSSHLADLSMGGVSNESYAIVGFSYDSGTQTATWTRAAPLPADQLQLHLTTATADIVGHPLDGEWADNVTTGNSGNGLPGGDFLFSFNVAAVVPNVVRGDLDFSGQSGATDVAAMLAALVDLPTYQSSHRLPDIDFLYIADINGDHVVNNADLQSLLYLLMHPPGGGDLPPSAAEAPAIESPLASVDPIAPPTEAAVSFAATAESVSIAEPIIPETVATTAGPEVQVRSSAPEIENNSSPAQHQRKGRLRDLIFILRPDPSVQRDVKTEVGSPTNPHEPAITAITSPPSLVDAALTDFGIRRRRHASFHEQISEESLAEDPGALL
jgi:hypothetical protein